MAPGDVVNLVKDAGLGGRGGAGFNTGLKWSFVPAPGRWTALSGHQWRRNGAGYL